MSGEFIDTNILVYAHDISAGKKQKSAQDLLEGLHIDKKGLLSVQVLAEFAETVTRKIPKPLEPDLVRDIISDFAFWRPYSPNCDDISAAVWISEKYTIHFWDAMIVRAADALGASVIWSEDLNNGQIYEGIVVRNLFQ